MTVIQRLKQFWQERCFGVSLSFFLAVLVKEKGAEPRKAALSGWTGTKWASCPAVILCLKQFHDACGKTVSPKELGFSVSLPTPSPLNVL